VGCLQSFYFSCDASAFHFSASACRPFWQSAACSGANFTAQNRFIIADVEDMRSVRKSIGQVSRGMLNTQVPAVLEYDLDAFMHSYLNAALNPEGAVAV